MRIVSYDSETFYSEDYSVATMGPQAYCADPRFDCYMLSFSDSDGWRWTGHPEECPWEKVFGPDVILLSVNTGFDFAVLYRLVELGLAPEPEYAAWYDVACLGAYLGAPRSLAGMAKTLLNIEASKEARSKAKGKHFCDFTPDEQEEMRIYAQKDADLPLEIWQKCQHLWPEHERWLSVHTLIMGQRGLPVNLEKVNAAIASLTEQRDAALELLPWAFSGTPLSKKMMAAQCALDGIEMPASMAKDSEECAEWEDKYADTYPWINAVRTYRRTNMLLLKFETIRDRTAPDGFFKYDLLYGGAHTMRWSGVGGFNCVTGDHEVLTPDGWIRIDAWDPEQLSIAQWDESGAISFTKGGKIIQEYSGKMIAVDTVDISLRATANHRIPQYGWKGAFQVRPASDILTSRPRIPTAGSLQQTITGDITTLNQVRLMAALAADGTEVVKRGKRNGAITFGFRKERKITRLRELLTAEGIKFREKSYTSGGKQTRLFYIRVADRPTWLRKGFGPWLLLLDGNLLEGLVTELPLWDGFFNHRSGNGQFTSILLDQAEWVKTAAHLSGKCASLNSYERSASGELIHYVYIKQSSIKGVANGCGRSVVSSEDVQGIKVFCPRVPSSFWLTRREGKIHVTGNCQNMSRETMFGCNMRECFEAPPGYKLIIADLSQIEPRVLAYLAGDNALLDAVRAGFGIYEAYARANMGWTGGSLKKEDPKQYTLAKALVLGLGYGCGYEKFIVVAKILAGLDVMDLYQPEDEAPVWHQPRNSKGRWLEPAERVSKRLVDRFRASNPKLAARRRFGDPTSEDGFWMTLENHMKKHAGTRQPCDFELPSGRVMRYLDVLGGEKMSAVTCKDGRMTRRALWGALLAENLTQGCSRDVFGFHLRLIEEAGIPIHLTVHDEVVCLVPEAEAEAALAKVLEIMHIAPPWMPGLPVAAEGKITNCYEK